VLIFLEPDRFQLPPQGVPEELQAFREAARNPDAPEADGGKCPSTTDISISGVARVYSESSPTS